MRLPTGHVQLIDISDKDSVGRYGKLNKLVYNALPTDPLGDAAKKADKRRKKSCCLWDLLFCLEYKNIAIVAIDFLSL